MKLDHIGGPPERVFPVDPNHVAVLQHPEPVPHHFGHRQARPLWPVDIPDVHFVVDRAGPDLAGQEMRCGKFRIQLGCVDLARVTFEVFTPPGREFGRLKSYRARIAGLHNIDQMMRAFLLANATAALLWLSVAFFLATQRR